MSELLTFIPAGGLGLRLQPHSFERPKPMFVMGHPERRIIDGPIELALTESSRVIVSTDYRAEQLEEYLAGISGVTSVRDTSTVGSGGSLIEHLQKEVDLDPEGDTLILPSDHVYEHFSLAELRQKHIEDEADITLLTVPKKNYGEYVEIEEGVPVSVETIASRSAVSTTGIFMFQNRFLLDEIASLKTQREEMHNIYKDIVCPAVGRRTVAQYFMDHPGFWEDTGTHERYVRTNLRISGGQTVIAENAYVHPLSVIERSVVLDGTVIDSPINVTDAIISSLDGKIIVTTTTGE